MILDRVYFCHLMHCLQNAALCFRMSMKNINTWKRTEAALIASQITETDCLSQDRHKAIIGTNAEPILLIRNVGTNFSGIVIKIHTVSFKKMHLTMSSGKWGTSGLGLYISITNDYKNGQMIAQYERPIKEWLKNNLYQNRTWEKTPPGDRYHKNTTRL